MKEKGKSRRAEAVCFLLAFLAAEACAYLAAEAGRIQKAGWL